LIRVETPEVVKKKKKNSSKKSWFFLVFKTYCTAELMEVLFSSELIKTQSHCCIVTTELIDYYELIIFLNYNNAML